MAEAEQEDNETIDEDFKNLRWTRVISLRDCKEMATHVYSMADDIKYVKQKMAAIKLDGLPQLCSYFDPIRWQEQNPQPHYEVYKLNHEQLKDWAEEATKIRKNILKKSELYELYRWPLPEVIVDKEPKSRLSVPHSTKSSNSEGLLES